MEHRHTLAILQTAAQVVEEGRAVVHLHIRMETPAEAAPEHLLKDITAADLVDNIMEGEVGAQAVMALAAVIDPMAATDYLSLFLDHTIIGVVVVVAAVTLAEAEMAALEEVEPELFILIKAAVAA